MPCPKGPATGNNPEGAAGPGQGRRYTLVDYTTGALIKEDVGDEIWNQYSVTSLPDAWVCEDPRCKPYCGAATPGPCATPPEQYAFRAQGGTPGSPVLACLRADGKYDVVDAQTGALVQGGIDEACFNQFDQIALADAGNPKCPGAAPAPPPTPEPPPPPPPAPVPQPVPPPSGGPVVVILPPPQPRPSPCDSGAWLRKYPARPQLGPVPLMRGRF